MCYEGLKVCVVIPAHNEAAFITPVIQSIPAWADAIVVVSDGSTDGTADLARRSGDPRLEVLDLAANNGVGGAMAAGYRRALELGSDIIVKMDGDGQMSASHLPNLLDAVVHEGYGYAKGNRFLDTSQGTNMPPARLAGNMILTFLTKVASGYWHVFDPQNGYTAITADALRKINLRAISRGYFFENDMLVNLNIHKCRVKDVSMPARYGGESSDVDPLHTVLTFPLLLGRRFLYRIYQRYVLRDFSPVALFLITGFLLFLWGVAFGAFLWIRGLVAGAPTPTGTIMLAVVPLFLGFQLLLQAIVLDIHETPR